jgi:LuxR family transcriptional regulator, maltose regulon positive regulatory protein
MFNREHIMYLTEREKEILEMVVTGLSNQQISDRLSITIRTVKFHTSNIYAKLGVRSRIEVILLAKNLIDD